MNRQMSLSLLNGAFATLLAPIEHICCHFPFPFHQFHFHSHFQLSIRTQMSLSGHAPAPPPDNLCCFLCKQLFNEPLILSCGHSFCRRCVEPWLRRSTICPFCRSPTLQPIPNMSLLQRVAEFRTRADQKGPSAKGAGNFIRGAIRRSLHPNKEARALQRESLRASQRRPKNVVLPAKRESPKVSDLVADLEGKLHFRQREDKPQQQAAHKGQLSRMNTLRRSISRIRNKFSAVSRNEERSGSADHLAADSAPAAHVSSPRGSLSFYDAQLRVLVLSAAGQDCQGQILSAFTAHLRNVEIQAVEETPTVSLALTRSIYGSDRVVLVYRMDGEHSLSRVRKLFQQYSPEEIRTMKAKVQFHLIALSVRQQGPRAVERSNGERLAQLLGTQLHEVNVDVLQETFPVWFRPARQNSRFGFQSPPPFHPSPLVINVRMGSGVCSPPAVRLLSPAARSQLSLHSNDSFRPAMGVSGVGLLRRRSAKEDETVREGKKAPDSGTGCTLM